MALEFNTQYPSVDDLRNKAKKRIPGGLFENTDVSKDHFGRLNDYQYDRVI